MKKQFNLQEWLQDKSRKVVTRHGSPVKIVCWDRKHDFPIIALEDCGNKEFVNFVTSDGKIDLSGLEDNHDLFFADEELTEFEKVVQNILNEPHFQDVQAVKQFSKPLLDLARKELEKDIEHSAVEFAKSYMEDVNPSFEKVKESEELWKWKMSCLKGVNKAYAKGKQDALKDLPKWKNVLNDKDFYLHEKLEDYFVKDTLHPNGCVKERWVLKKSDLDKLPKEE